MMRIWRAAALAAATLATTIPAAAADGDLPRISGTFGVGVANPLHGDLSFNAFAWQTSVRVATSRHMVIEPFYGEWRHTTTRVISGVTIQGPGGVLGQVDRITQRTEETRPAVGFNVLGAWSAGRVTVLAGGGPGVLLFRRHFTETLEGCHGANVRCTGVDNRFSSGSFDVQAVAGLDVTVASRFGVFGEFRLAVPVEDIGSGQTSVVGGVRVRIW